MMAYTNMNKLEEYPETDSNPPGYVWKPNSPTSTTGSTEQFVDPEDLSAKNIGFSDETIRRGFIRKVYLILMAQLSVTLGFVAIFIFDDRLRQLSAENPAMLLSAIILTFALLIAMSCCETTRRTYPMNLICLGLFTVAESFLVGNIASYYDRNTVLLALGITVILCFSLSIFAMQTKYDFTAWGGFLLLALICLMIFGFVGVLMRDHFMRTLYAGIFGLLACVYLIYDTQIMVGGKHKYSISPEEYIFAALSLYIDVIQIFLRVLQLMGRK